MNWLFPGFLAGTVLIGLPVVLHLLRMKPRAVVRFPTLRFLGETALRDTRRHQLRRWLTLLLRCVVMGAVAAAFARPFWGQPAGQGRAMVVAVDNSMSMATGGRWDQLRAWAMEQLSPLGPGDQAALLVMHPEPAWLLPLTDDLARVRAALQSAQPGFEKTRYAKPLRLAGETLARSPAATKTLVWMADEQLAGWRGADLTQKLPPGVAVRFADAVPAPQRQAASIALRQSAGPNSGIEATIRQFHATPDQRRLTVRAGERVLAEKQVSLHAGDNAILIPVQWPANAAGLRVSLDADDLPADDAAWIAGIATATHQIFLDSVTDTDFLTHALRATQKLGEAGFQPAPLPESVWPEDAVVVLRQGSSFRDAALERLNRFVAAGGAVWVFVNGAPEQADWLARQGVRVSARGTPDTPWHLRDWDSEHPILGAFAGQSLLPLLEVEFHQGFNLAGDALSPLANWPDGKAAIAEWNAEGRRILVAGFPADREAMDWLTRPSFVPFVHRAAHWLGAVKDARTDWRVGDTIPLPDGPGLWRALDSPWTQKEQAVNGSVRPAAPGLYEFNAGGTRKIFAVNVPVEESDLSPWPKPEELAALESKESPALRRQTASGSAAQREAAENRQRLWWWVLALGGLALLAELGLANRTSL